MKIELIGELKTVMSNPMSKHNYFGWPTVCRLQNGKIAVAASGFRLAHVCPFGKTVISYSEDEGESFTAPAPIIDTALDDRDGGVMTFGESGVIVNSFNNTCEFQRNYAKNYNNNPYIFAYLDTVTQAEEEASLGVTFRISHDCGVTFGPLHKSPVGSPHGPIQISDGRILWMGNVRGWRSAELDGTRLRVYRVYETGEMEFLANVPDVPGGLSADEPYMAEAPDGTLLAHIRSEDGANGTTGDKKFTIFQTESHDGGKTWTVPHQILSNLGGAPAHILRTADGMLISTYGYRAAPYGIRMAVSTDNGKTWERDFEINVNGVTYDIGYPSTVALEDGSYFTVFYAHRTKDEPATILGQKWRFV
jgi:hypothetical protein